MVCFVSANCGALFSFFPSDKHVMTVFGFAFVLVNLVFSTVLNSNNSCCSMFYFLFVFNKRECRCENFTTAVAADGNHVSY